MIAVAGALDVRGRGGLELKVGPCLGRGRRPARRTALALDEAFLSRACLENFSLQAIIFLLFLCMKVNGR